MSKIDSEQKILGCFLSHDKLESPLVTEALLITDESFFESADHKQIFKYLRHVYFNSKPVDTLDIKGVDFGYVSSLQNNPCANENLIAYCKQLKNQYDLKEIKNLISIANDNLSTCVDHSESKSIVDVLSHQIIKKSHSGMNLADGVQVSKSIYDRLDKTKSLERMPTGDAELDKILGGGILKPSIIVLGGQSGTGKTTFAAKILNHLSIEQKYKSAFFSLEMSVSEVGVMAACHNKKITRANFEKQDDGFFASAHNKLESNDSLIISANKSLSIEDIFLEARYIKAKQGLDIVFIDFLTALRVKQRVSSDYEKINFIMGEIGRLSADLNVAVILLAQVNRELSNSRDGKPAMQHLKGSSSIENFADYILFTHRDSVANPDCSHDYLELLVRKNRYGKNGSVFYESIDGTIFDTNQDRAKVFTQGQVSKMYNFKPAIKL